MVLVLAGCTPGVMPMAHRAHPSDQVPQSLGPQQQALLSIYAPLERDDHHLTCVGCGHSEPLPISPVGTGSLGLTKVLPQGFKPLFHTFELHGLCSSCQQSNPPAHG